MSTESIFADGQTPPVEPVVEPNPAPVVSNVPQELAELVGDGKKYKTVEEAIKSVVPAQKHIQTLEQELADLRVKAAKVAATEELLEEIRKQGITPAATQTPQTNGTSPQVTPVDIDKKVEEILNRKAMAAVQATNRQAVIQAFEQAYGKEGGEAAYVKLAQENNLPLGELNRLAVTSPEAVLRLAGIKKATSVVHPSSSVNTSGALSERNEEELSAKVKMVGSSTKDVTAAWHRAGQKVQQKLKQ